MPAEEFDDLKYKATYFQKLEYGIILPDIALIIKNYIMELQNINFNEVFPGYDFKEILPQLQVDEDGYTKFDVEQVIADLDYDPKHYDDGKMEILIKHFLESNSNFNLYEIVDTLKELNMAEVEKKEEIKAFLEGFIEYIIEEYSKNDQTNQIDIAQYIESLKYYVKIYLKLFQKLNFKELFPNDDINEKFPQLQIGEDGYAKFDFDQVYSGFNFDPEYYKSLIEEGGDINNLESMMFESNKDFNIKEVIENISKLDEDSIDMIALQNIVKSVQLSVNKMITNAPQENINMTEINEAFYDGYLTDFKTKNATMTFELNG